LVASYRAVADTAHGQECPATIHGAQATVAMWATSSGLSLGFEGATLGKRGQIPLGRASEAA
jgi:hypothetical protein